MAINVFGAGVEQVIQEKWAGKFSQRRASDDLGISPSRISKIIDKNGDPKLSTMTLWSEMLGISVSGILKTGELAIKNEKK